LFSIFNTNSTEKKHSWKGKWLEKLDVIKIMFAMRRFVTIVCVVCNFELKYNPELGSWKKELL